MRLFIFIITLFLLACGQHSTEKKVTADTLPVSTDTLSTGKEPGTFSESSEPVFTALANRVNIILNSRDGNKWHVLNDREAKWMSGQFEYFIAPKRKDNPDYPYIAQGDFNGDQKEDIAAVVTDTTKTRYQLAILLDAGGASPQLVSWEEDILEDAAISAIPRSEIEGFEGEKTKKVKLKAAGINVEYFEKAAFVIYWNGSAFKRIQTGD